MEILNESGISVQFADNLCENVSSIGLIKSHQPVIFVEQLRKTKYSDALKEIEFCNLQDAEIWGYMTILI